MVMIIIKKKESAVIKKLLTLLINFSLRRQKAGRGEDKLVVWVINISLHRNYFNTISF